MRKHCPICGKTKISKNFYKDASRKDGISGRCKICSLAATKKWQARNKDWVLQRNRKSNQRSSLAKLGMTVSDYDAMFSVQHGCCAICGKHQSDLNRALAVDHNHQTGEVRALLCCPCNAALGVFKEESFLCRQAAQYLESFMEDENESV